MKICLVAHFAYGALAGGSEGHFGGVERQTSLMAKWLAARGHEVSVITWDEGQPDGEEIDGVRVWKTCPRDTGVPGIRFFHPRWTTLVSALRRADAEIYYQNCAEYVTGQVALWCRRNGRRFVYSVASDPDCDNRLPKMVKPHERVLYRYGLKSSDDIIVQTKKQQSMLLNGFGLKSIPLPMPCVGPSEDEFVQPVPPSENEKKVVWVGRVSVVKRLEMLLEIAENMPEVQFIIAGGPDKQTDYSRKVLGQAAEMDNVVCLGRIGMGQVGNLYSSSHVLCCTSRYEGFPNTFLEAWSRGIPVVSTVDPDGLIQGKGLGGVGTDLITLKEKLGDLLCNQGEWLSVSRRARLYYLENHQTDQALERFEKVFMKAVRNEI